MLTLPSCSALNTSQPQTGTEDELSEKPAKLLTLHSSLQETRDARDDLFDHDLQSFTSFLAPASRVSFTFRLTVFPGLTHLYSIHLLCPTRITSGRQALIDACHIYLMGLPRTHSSLCPARFTRFYKDIFFRKLEQMGPIPSVREGEEALSNPMSDLRSTRTLNGSKRYANVISSVPPGLLVFSSMRRG